LRLFGAVAGLFRGFDFIVQGYPHARHPAITTRAPSRYPIPTS
jgi:hypothetical protein